MKAWALILCLFASAALGQAEERTLELGDGAMVRYALVDPAAPAPLSARETATRVLRHLAAGNLEEAAVLSNSPKRRYEVLRDYQGSVGETEFKRAFAQYLFPENRVLAEIAIGARRLLIWELGEAGNHLAGQYYVEVDGRFLMDDVPSEERSRLRHVLEAYRTKKIPR
jgi:hypothetical protein